MAPFLTDVSMAWKSPREHFDRPFAVLGLDGLADLAHMGPESGLRLSVDGLPAEAAAVLPYRRFVTGHFFLLFKGAYDRIS